MTIIRTIGSATRSQTIGPTSITAHRYWRIFVDQVQGGGTNLGISEISLASSIGGSNLIGSGTAISSPNPALPPSAAVDGNTSTFWNNDFNLPSWLGYDFGAGQDKIILEVKITSRLDHPELGPGRWYLEYSDDGVLWSRILQTFTPATWVSGVAQTFDITNPATIDQVSTIADHYDFKSWVAWVIANATDTGLSGGNLTDNIEAHIMGELVLNSGSGEQIITGWQSGPSNFTTTVRAASGQSFRENINIRSNALYYNPANGAAIKSINFFGAAIQYSIDNFFLKDLQLNSTVYTSAFSNNVAPCNNLTIDNCIILQSNNNNGPFDGHDINGSILIKNTVFIATGTSNSGLGRIEAITEIDNCIIMVPNGSSGRGIINDSNGLNIQFTNTAIIGFATDLSSDFGGTFSGSHNATSNSSWGGGTFGGGTNAQLNVVAATEFVNATNDFRIKKTTSVKLKGNGTTSGTPATDISGYNRGSTVDIGAYQVSGIPTIRTIGTPNDPGAHRYWRIFSPDITHDVALGEVSFANSQGGSNLIGSGTASASSEFYGSGFAATKAVDGDSGTSWVTQPQGSPTWWKYDFGSGNDVDILEVKITPRSDAPSQTPAIWTLQYSDNNSIWTDVHTFTAASWVSGVVQTFDVPVIATVNHTDINDWVAWVIANVTDTGLTGGNLVDDIEAQIVGELLVSSTQAIAGWNASSNNFITTITALPGTSFRENPNVRTNALYYNAANGAAIRCTSGADLIDLTSNGGHLVTFKNLQMKASGNVIASNASNGFTPGYDIDHCILECTGGGNACANSGINVNFTNSLFVSSAPSNGYGLYAISSAGIFSQIKNCTVVSVAGNGVSFNSSFINIVNTALIGFNISDSGSTNTGSNNATDKISWADSSSATNAQISVVPATEFVNATNDFRLKPNAVKLKGTGVTIGGLTTDISGKGRNNPPSIGAWETTLVVTKSIGSSGRDYVDPQAWINAIPLNLITADEIHIGEMYNDSEFVSSSPYTFSSSLTTDADHYITLRAATGHSFRDHPESPLRYDPANGVAVHFTSRGGMLNQHDGFRQYINVKGIQVRCVSVGIGGSSGGIVDSCLVDIEGFWEGAVINGARHNPIPAVVQNSVFIRRSPTSGGALTIGFCCHAYNNTILSGSDLNNPNAGMAVADFNEDTNVIKNNAIFGFATALTIGIGPLTVDYIATDAASVVGGGTHNLTNLTYANQFKNVFDATIDARLRSGNSLMGAGVSGGDIPTLDILGTTRANPPAIGAWETVFAGASSIIINFID